MEHTGLQSLPPDTALLVRYCAGETTPQENLWIRRWEAQSPSHAEWLADVREFWNLVSDSGPSWSVDAMRDRMLNAIASLESKPVAPSAIELNVGGQRPPLTAAARTTSVPLGMGAWSRLQRMLAVGVAASVFVASAVWVGVRAKATPEVFSEASTYTTPRGQRANVTLPDGSTVLLNVGSLLRVPADFAKGNRVLQLDGEAFFVVNHRPDHPFTVIAGASVTRVLGTRFVVRHYDSDSNATVAVQDGKVSVRQANAPRGMSRDAEVVLSAGEQAEVSPERLSSVSRATNARFSFAKNRLIIDGRRLQDAIPDLNRWYDVDIRLGDREIGAMELILESTGNSLGDLQTIFEQTLALRVVREGRVITIYQR